MSVSIGSDLYALYVLRTGARGAIDLHGEKDELEAIDHLIRSYLDRVVYRVADPLSLAEAKERITAAVAKAIVHCDDDDKPAPHDPSDCESDECEECGANEALP